MTGSTSVFECGKYAELGRYVEVEGGKVPMDRAVSGIPCMRWHGLRIQFSRETRIGLSEPTLVQHNGDTNAKMSVIS